MSKSRGRGGDSSTESLFNKWTQENQAGTGRGVMGHKFEQQGVERIRIHSQQLFEFAEVVPGLRLITNGSKELADFCRASGFPVPYFVNMEFTPGRRGADRTDNLKIKFSNDERQTVIEVNVSKHRGKVGINTLVQGSRNFTGHLTQEAARRLAPQVAAEILDLLGAFRDIPVRRLELPVEVFPPGAPFGGQGSAEGYGQEKPGIGSEVAFDIFRFAGARMSQTLTAAFALQSSPAENPRRRVESPNSLFGMPMQIEATKFPDFMMWVFEYGVMLQSAKVGNAYYMMRFDKGPLTEEEKQIFKTHDDRSIKHVLKERGVLDFVSTSRDILRTEALANPNIRRHRHASQYDEGEKSLQVEKIRNIVDELWPAQHRGSTRRGVKILK